jgi:ethanolamine utilization protein EutQ (cupin superfamily)
MNDKLSTYRASERRFVDFPYGKISEDRCRNIDHASLIAGEMKFSDPAVHQYADHDAYLMIVGGSARIDTNGSESVYGYSDAIWLPRGAQAKITPVGEATVFFSFTPGCVPVPVKDGRPSKPSSVYKNAERRYVPRRGKTFTAWMCREVFRDNSNAMGNGIIVYENARMPRIPGFDCYYRCLEGEFRMRTASDLYVLKPGDAVWMPNTSEMLWEIDEYTACAYALHPVDWEVRKAK